MSILDKSISSITPSSLFNEALSLSSPLFIESIRSFCSCCLLVLRTKSIIKIAKRTPKKINNPLDDETVEASLSDASCAFAFSSIGPSEIEDLKELSVGVEVSLLFASTSLGLFISEFKSGLESTAGALLAESLV